MIRNIDLTEEAHDILIESIERLNVQNLDFLPKSSVNKLLRDSHEVREKLKNFELFMSADDLRIFYITLSLLIESAEESPLTALSKHTLAAKELLSAVNDTLLAGGYDMNKI